MKSFTKILLLFLLTNWCIGCTQSTTDQEKTPKVQEIVVLDDGYKTTDKGEILLDDQNQNGLTINTLKEHIEESTKTASDGSQIKIMYDGYGNKTITRFFNNHPLISGVVTRISAKGKYKTFIYTKDGLVKPVSQKYKNVIEAKSANEIARKVGIFTLDKSDSYKPLIAENTKDETEMPVNNDLDDIDNLSPSKLPEVAENIESPKPKNAESIEQRQVQTVLENSYLSEFIEKTGKSEKVKKLKNISKQ